MLMYRQQETLQVTKNIDIDFLFSCVDTRMLASICIFTLVNDIMVKYKLVST